MLHLAQVVLVAWAKQGLVVKLQGRLPWEELEHLVAQCPGRLMQVALAKQGLHLEQAQACLKQPEQGQKSQTLELAESCLLPAILAPRGLPKAPAPS
jgi:hypothetical protein